MKVSVITVCLNSEKTIERCIQSVISQNYNDYEYIVIDGNSSDNTFSIITSYKSKITKIISEDDTGIYDAMNKGIKLARGEIISLLNSDDLYASKSTLKTVVNEFSRSNKKIIFGNLHYFREDKCHVIKRNDIPRYFRKWHLHVGCIPRHPATFIHSSLYQQYGLYNSNIKSASDFDLFLRLFLVHNEPYLYINELLVLMQHGGKSSSGIKSVFNSTIDICKSFKFNKLRYNIFFIISRIPIKLIYLFNHRVKYFINSLL